MGSGGWMLFLATVLGIYALVGAYLLGRFRRVLLALGVTSPLPMDLAMALVCAYPAGRLLERLLPGTFSAGLILLGSVALAFGLHALPVVLVLHVLSGANRFVPLLPAWVKLRPERAALHALLLTLFLAGGATLGGALAARMPVVRLQSLDLAETSPARTLRVAAATDLHAGTLVGPGRIRDLGRRLEALKPDLILLGGDLLDEDIPSLSPERETEFREAFRSLRAPLGTWAVLGNHEIYQGAKRSAAFLESAGIRVLVDRWAQPDPGLVLAGRMDRAGLRFALPRLPLDRILEGAPDLPVLLLDHTPTASALEEAAARKVALVLSGHTHYGQLFPFQWVVARLFPLPRGTRRMGPTTAVVSPGYGTWGPPVRTSCFPEILLLEVRLPALPPPSP
ncbi:metallophosphoesterase [Aminomonas paucivorans DSM 12260]|uniref:Metallophosphoesterase n=1 Tax=Aminomonas paucivorans DSM 12260 TaxID=584708 RepID=E3D019_9BACT|nr:metallophosphoesterase [Aminomonas paucivorans]EFQ22951.1 metallophosphoesterase [Aminomonas paucivorans DSM 12260]